MAGWWLSLPVTALGMRLLPPAALVGMREVLRPPTFSHHLQGLSEGLTLFLRRVPRAWELNGAKHPMVAAKGWWCHQVTLVSPLCPQV